MTKRSFADRFLALALSMIMVFSVTATTVTMTACSSSQALADVKRFEPVLVSALSLICTINASAPVCGITQGKIKADGDLVIKIWGDYNTAVANGTSTVKIWNDLNAAFTVFEEDASAIFATGIGLNQAQVTAIVASAQVLLAAIEAFFPQPPVGVTVAKSAKFAKYGVATGSYDKVWFSGWAKDYNAKVDVARKAYPKAKLSKVRTGWF